MTVRLPPGFRTRESARSAASGSRRCSSTKQTKTWSNDASANGRAKMSACWNATLAAATVRPGLGQRGLGDVDAREVRLGAVGGEDHRLRADAAAGLEHAAAGGVARVAVQELGQRRRPGRRAASPPSWRTRGRRPSRHCRIFLGVAAENPCVALGGLLRQIARRDVSPRPSRPTPLPTPEGDARIPPRRGCRDHAPLPAHLHSPKELRVTMVLDRMRNGVDSAQMYGTLDAIKAAPTLGIFRSAPTTTGSTAPTTARPSRASTAPARRTRPAPPRSRSTPASPPSCSAATPGRTRPSTSCTPSPRA